MREIKFRAWNTFIKKMYDFNTIKNSGIFALDKGLDGNDFLVLPLKNIELMQYTGLKDKNGVEIYEKDVLECRGWNKTEQEWVKNFLIVFIDGCFALKGTDGGMYGLFKNSKVIGNIHENPELLESK